MLKLLFVIVLALPLPVAAQSDHARHDAAMAAIRNVKAVVDTTVPIVHQTAGQVTTTIVGAVGDITFNPFSIPRSP